MVQYSCSRELIPWAHGYRRRIIDSVKVIYPESADGDEDGCGPTRREKVGTGLSRARRAQESRGIGSAGPVPNMPGGRVSA